MIPQRSSQAGDGVPQGCWHALEFLRTGNRSIDGCHQACEFRPLIALQGCFDLAGQRHVRLHERSDLTELHLQGNGGYSRPDRGRGLGGCQAGHGDESGLLQALGCEHGPEIGTVLDGQFGTGGEQRLGRVVHAVHPLKACQCLSDVACHGGRVARRAENCRQLSEVG